jgi:phosphatidylethanolamine/phosphatidyl-N-methylethanolamine N-methyltransferase
LKNIPHQAKFFALEINPKFVIETKKRCPDASVYQDDALNIKKYLNELNLKARDCIISGPPFTAFSEENQRKFLSIISESLSLGGRFITYTYVHRIKSKGNLRLQKPLPEKFSRLEASRIVWKNPPPAYVYCAIK